MTFSELQKKIQWTDFHDMSLIELSIDCLDKRTLEYSGDIKLIILIGYENEWETDHIIELTCKQINNLNINMPIQKFDIKEFSSINKLQYCNNSFLLDLQNGTCITFQTSNIQVIEIYNK